MKNELKVSLIQMNSQGDRAANLRNAEALIRQVVRDEGPDLVLLPEYFEFYAGEAEGKISKAQDVPGSDAYLAMQALARELNVWIHVGSLIERVAGENRVHNSTIAFNRKGEQVATYRKIHMFDIVAPDGTAYKESSTVKPGNEIVTYDLEGFKVGCVICYDIRFAELFIQLAQQDCDLIAVPAAFAMQTGKDHWEVLLRARAIETQCYVVAPAQTGTYLANGERRMTYGNSIVCDPWGTVIARASDGVGTISARLQRSQIDRVRKAIPMMAHRRLGVQHRSAQ